MPCMNPPLIRPHLVSSLTSLDLQTMEFSRRSPATTPNLASCWQPMAGEQLRKRACWGPTPWATESWLDVEQHPPNSRAVCICEVGFGAGPPNHHITPYSMQISNSDQSREAVVPPDERFAHVCIIFHFWLCESQSQQEWRGALDSYVRTPASVICTREEITKTLHRR